PRKLEKMFLVSERQVDVLSRLVDDLLDVVRITNGRLELHPETLNFSDCLNTVIERFSEQLHSQEIELKVEMPSQVLARCDQNRMEQVLMNLISNAIKYGDR